MPVLEPIVTVRVIESLPYANIVVGMRTVRAIARTQPFTSVTRYASNVSVVAGVSMNSPTVPESQLVT